jgi:cytochrome c biogenesis protein CcdA
MFHFLATTLCLDLAIVVSASYLGVCTLLIVHLMAFHTYYTNFPVHLILITFGFHRSGNSHYGILFLGEKSSCGVERLAGCPFL